MKARALKDFKGKYGHIRTGTIFECEPGYFRALSEFRMVEKVDDAKPAEPAPEKNRSIPEAPNKAGKETPAGQGKPPGAMVHPRGAGKTTMSRSLRADLQSRKKTSKASAAGEPNPEDQTPPPAA